MRPTSVSQAPAPQAPAAPSAPGTAVTVQTPILPPTLREYQELVAHRERLSSQLASVELHRNSLVVQLPSAPGPQKAALAQAIHGLDQQMQVIGGELAATERMLEALQPTPVATTEPPRSWESPLSSGQATAVSIVFTLFVLFPLALAAARLIWKRGSISAAALPPEASTRLDRIEQAVDTIALEVERISEGQRFVTRVLGAGQSAALGNQWPAEDVKPAAEPVPIPRRD